MKKLFFTLALPLFLLVFISCVPVTAVTTLVFSDTYSVDEVKSINMDLSCESIIVENWDEDYIEVSVYSSNNRYPSIDLIGRELVGKTQIGILNWFTCKVVISIPTSYYADSWCLSTASGSIKADNLYGDIIEVNSTSGSIKLKECGCQTMETKTTSGRIEIEKSLAIQSISLFSTSGSIDFNGRSNNIESKTTSGSIDIAIESKMPLEINAISTSGSIKIRLPDNDGFTHNYNATSGSIENEFLGFQGHKKGTTQYRNGSAKITTSSTSGKISIQRQ